MAQAADKIAELKQERDNLLWKWGELTVEVEKMIKLQEDYLDHSIEFSPPDSITEKAAIAKLQSVTPEQVTEWLGEAYGVYQSIALQQMQG